MRPKRRSIRVENLFELQIGEVTSPTDGRIGDYLNLKDVALRRRIEPERGLYMAESTYVIQRALAAGHVPRSFLTSWQHLPIIKDVVAQLPTESTGGQAEVIPVFVAPDAVLEQITGFRVHRGALAAMQRPALPSVAEILGNGLDARRRIVVLEDIVDHTNVGAIFRSVAALGADGVLITPQCADPLYRRSVRVSMGTVFAIPWTRIESWPSGIEQLRDAGYTTAALALGEESLNLTEFAAQNPERVALVLGTEGDGLQKRTLAQCDVAVRIPMRPDVDSLNVAAACAVALWALT